MFYKIDPLKNFGKLTGKIIVPESFLLDKVVHHQACNFAKKRLQHRRFTVYFAQLVKAPCRTQLVSAYDFNATFITIKQRKTFSCSLERLNPLDSTLNFDSKKLCFWRYYATFLLRS